MATKTEWYKDNYVISTNPSLIQPAAVNAAFDSDLIYWTKAVDEGELKRMLEGSLCFGLYALPGSSAEIAGVSFSQCKIGIVSRAEYEQAETTQSKSV